MGLGSNVYRLINPRYLSTTSAQAIQLAASHESSTSRTSVQQFSTHNTVTLSTRTRQRRPRSRVQQNLAPRLPPPLRYLRLRRNPKVRTDVFLCRTAILIQKDATETGGWDATRIRLYQHLEQRSAIDPPLQPEVTTHHVFFARSLLAARCRSPTQFALRLRGKKIRQPSRCRGP